MINMINSLISLKNKKITGTVLPQIGPTAAETTPTAAAAAATPSWETEAIKAEATVKRSMEAVKAVEVPMEGHSLVCY